LGGLKNVFDSQGIHVCAVESETEIGGGNSEAGAHGFGKTLQYFFFFFFFPALAVLS